jgi:hypothetical protein
VRVFARIRRRDDHIQEALGNTTESWKRGLLISAGESATRERWIIRIAAATLVVSIIGVLVALFH